jgi:serine/threonine protein kinase
MHDRKIAHLDIKADNILLDERGRVVIIDFGLASKFTGDNDRLIYCGTRPFMAPELFELETGGSKKGSMSKVDIFAFSMLIWQLLTGNEPWAREKYSSEQLSEAVRRGDRPQTDARRWGTLTSLILRCWSKNPSSRPDIETILSTL